MDKNMIEIWFAQLSQLWLFKFAVFWAAIDLFMIATGWYAVTVIKPKFPDWWKRTIVDMVPAELEALYDEEIDGEVIRTLSKQASTLES